MPDRPAYYSPTSDLLQVQLAGVDGMQLGTLSQARLKTHGEQFLSGIVAEFSEQMPALRVLVNGRDLFRGRLQSLIEEATGPMLCDHTDGAKTSLYFFGDRERMEILNLIMPNFGLAPLLTANRIPPIPATANMISVIAPDTPPQKDSRYKFGHPHIY